jgi:hypothetical protein
MSACGVLLRLFHAGIAIAKKAGMVPLQVS